MNNASSPGEGASSPVTTYLYHLYGEDEIFRAEAAYSIGSLLRKTDPARTRIVLFTDDPARVRSLPVVCESIADEIQAMRGPSGFGYRIKLCCILKCAKKFPGNIIYLDCDTIVKGPIHDVAAGLGNRQALMYKQERLADRFPEFYGFKMKLPDGAEYRYGPESCMFNAGVIGFHSNNAKAFETALAICDALLADGRRNHICEQFAVTEAFRIAGLNILAADKVVAPYYRGSAKRYMHDQLSRFAAMNKGELWKPERPIPYSYPRVQLHKLMRKLGK